MRRVVTFAALLLVLPIAAHAQNANVIDQVVQRYQAATAGWSGSLLQMAQNTFFILATIQVAWAFLRLAVRNASYSEFVAEFVSQIMYVGIFLWGLTTTTTWGPAIINTFRQAGGMASGTTVLTPGDIFAVGIQVSTTIMAQMSVWSPESSVGLLICGVVVMVVFALMAALMVVALVRAYFIGGCGVLFMAFGGSVWTNEIAMAVVRKTLSIGAGLFTLQLIMSVGLTFIQQWVTQFNDVTSKGVAIEIGQAIVLLAVAWIIPDDIASMIGSGSFGHAGALIGAAAGTAGAAAAVGSGAARVATGIAGAGAAAGGAARLASTQVAARVSRGTGPTSTAGRVAALAGNTVRNAAGAIGGDIGRRLSGQTMIRGTTGFRMAADLSQQNEELQSNTPGLAPYQNRRP